MKIRSDFVTNSSSSSFIMIDINSPTFAGIINRFKEELEEQNWFNIQDLDDTHVSLFGDEMYGNIPTDVSDLIPALARIFYEEVYVPGEYDNEEEDEDARLAFEEVIADFEEDEDISCGLEIRIAKEIIDARAEIELDVLNVDIRCGNVGWGGDDESRYEKDNYSEEQLKDIYETIAAEKGCSIEEVDDDDFSLYVGGQISNEEEVFTYDRASGKVESYRTFSLD